MKEQAPPTTLTRGLKNGVHFTELPVRFPHHLGYNFLSVLAWFILNAFFLIALALLVTLGLGIAFRSFRVWLLEKFPHNRFNGSPEDDPGETFRLRDTGE